MTHILQVFLDGSILGASYVLVALGFSLIFGVMGILNVAQADFLMVGAFISYWAVNNFGQSIWVALLSGVVAGIVLGGVFYVVVVRRLTADQSLAVFVATIGISLFLQNLVARIAGPGDHSYPALISSRYHHIGGLVITTPDAAVLLTTLLLSGALICWLRFTGSGTDIRTVAESRFVAAAVGINVKRVILTAVFITVVIASVGGVLTASSDQTINPFLGNTLALKMFIVVVIAGVGSVGGAVAVGFGLGVVESCAVAYLNSGWQDLVGLLLVIVIILLRPEGLFGRTARIG